MTQTAEQAGLAELDLGQCRERSGYLREAGRPGHMVHVVLPPAAGATGSRGVVWCPPLSGEKQYSARSLVLMSRQFAAAGIPCIRHDPTGCGDSEGTSADIRLEGLVEDALRAAELLRRQSGATQVVYIGLLLGGAVARLAAARDPGGRAAAVLVDPLLDGRAWWQQLLKQQQMSFMTRGQPVPRLEALAAGDAEGRVEIKAELYHPAFIAELQQLDPVRCTQDPVSAELVVRIGAAASPADAGTALASAEHWQEDGPNFWNDKSLYGGYWPAALSLKLQAWVRGLDA